MGSGKRQALRQDTDIFPLAAIKSYLSRTFPCDEQLALLTRGKKRDKGFYTLEWEYRTYRTIIIVSDANTITTKRNDMHFVELASFQTTLKTYYWNRQKVRNYGRKLNYRGDISVLSRSKYTVSRGVLNIFNIYLKFSIIDGVCLMLFYFQKITICFARLHEYVRYFDV